MAHFIQFPGQTNHVHQIKGTKTLCGKDLEEAQYEYKFKDKDMLCSGCVKAQTEQVNYLRDEVHRIQTVEQAIRSVHSVNILKSMMKDDEQMLLELCEVLSVEGQRLSAALNGDGQDIEVAPLSGDRVRVCYEKNNQPQVRTYSVKEIAQSIGAMKEMFFGQFVTKN